MEAKIEVKSTIEKMEVGDVQSFDIELLPNVRSYASSVGLQYGRQYKTRTDRENMTITVERLAWHHDDKALPKVGLIRMQPLIASPAVKPGNVEKMEAGETPA